VRKGIYDFLGKHAYDKNEEVKNRAMEIIGVINRIRPEVNINQEELEKFLSRLWRTIYFATEIDTTHANQKFK
jgi:hypothetical protein